MNFLRKQDWKDFQSISASKILITIKSEKKEQDDQTYHVDQNDHVGQNDHVDQNDHVGQNDHVDQNICVDQNGQEWSWMTKDDW